MSEGCCYVLTRTRPDPRPDRELICSATIVVHVGPYEPSSSHLSFKIGDGGAECDRLHRQWNRQ